MRFPYFLFFLLFLSCLKSNGTSSFKDVPYENSRLEHQVQTAIKRGSCNLWKMRNTVPADNKQNPDNSNMNSEHNFWSMGLWQGTYYLSQYYLLQKWMGRSTEAMDLDYYASLLIKSQLKNGSWLAVQDKYIQNIVNSNPDTIQYGELEPTTFIYWTLKSMLELQELNPATAQKISDEKVLARALSFINAKRQQSGDGFSDILKIFFALFSLYDWEDVIERNFLQKFAGISAVPLEFANNEWKSLIATSDFGQWVAPLLKPLAYALHLRLQKNVGKEFDIRKDFRLPLYQNKKQKDENLDQGGIDKLIKNILSGQEENGSFGGYTLHSHFTAAVFSDYIERFVNCENQPSLCSDLTIAITKAQKFNEHMYFNKPFLVNSPDKWGTFSSSYLGTTCDGSFWDTVLAGQALAKAGVGPEKLTKTVNFVLYQQSKTTPFEGYRGFPFGFDFWKYPDNDDTAEYIIFLEQFKKSLAASSNNDMLIVAIDNAIENALGFLLKMQNSNGGWGAFSHENNGNWFSKELTKSLQTSADLFDEATVDVTGHVLEAIADLDVPVSQQKQVDRAIKAATKYILKHQASYYLKDRSGAFIRDQSGHFEKAKGPWFGRWGINYIYGTHAVINGLAKHTHSSNYSIEINRAVKWLQQVQNKDGGFGESYLSYQKAPNIFMGLGPSTPSQTAWGLSALIASGNHESESTKNAVAYLIKDIQEHGAWTDQSTVGTGHPNVLYLHYPIYAYTFPLIALAQYRDAMGWKRKEVFCD